MTSTETESATSPCLPAQVNGEEDIILSLIFDTTILLSIQSGALQYKKQTSTLTYSS